MSSESSAWLGFLKLTYKTSASLSYVAQILGYVTSNSVGTRFNFEGQHGREAHQGSLQVVFSAVLKRR